LWHRECISLSEFHPFNSSILGQLYASQSFISISQF
jgi:hypothetical protein